MAGIAEEEAVVASAGAQRAEVIGGAAGAAVGAAVEGKAAAEAAGKSGVERRRPEKRRASRAALPELQARV